jgi:hypothetical protein
MCQLREQREEVGLALGLVGKVREELKKGGINEADALDRETWRGHVYSLTNPHP